MIMRKVKNQFRTTKDNLINALKELGQLSKGYLSNLQWQHRLKPYVMSVCTSQQMSSDHLDRTTATVTDHNPIFLV